MNPTEELINKIAQGRLDFNLGIQVILENTEYNFEKLLSTLKIFIFNTIPDKTDYNSETYQNAIRTIPLKPTYTPIILLKRFPAKIAFNKLTELPKSEHTKILISLIWIFKVTDTERRNTECKNGCGHYWHEMD